MNDKDWRTLIYSITQENCILVLGPEIPVAEEAPGPGPGETSLPPQFRHEGPMTLPELLANQLCFDLAVTNLDPYNLAQVAEFHSRKHGRNELVMEVDSFYRQAPRSEVYSQLAKVPFNLIISLAHDPGLVDALVAEGRSPVVESYDFRGNQKAFLGLGRDGVGSAERPLVYYLYGHIDNGQSLVLTESDTLDFLSAVMSKNPELPRDLRSHLNDNNKSFLLLGFGLTRWYLRILLHVLKVNKRETRSFALERLTDRDPDLLQKTILFMKKGLRIESYDSEVETFTRELAARVEASGVARRPVCGGGGPRGQVIAGPRPAPPQLLEPPSVFISYASEDEAHARKLVDVLQASGLDPWFDKQGLRGGDRWDDAIRNALNEVDYVVVVQSAALAAKVRSYVNREIDLALQNQQLVRRGFCYLIPVRVDDSPELDELKHLQTVDVRDDAGCQDLVNVILRDQQRLRKKVA